MQHNSSITSNDIENLTLNSHPRHYAKLSRIGHVVESLQPSLESIVKLLRERTPFGKRSLYHNSQAG